MVTALLADDSKDMTIKDEEGQMREQQGEARFRAIFEGAALGIELIDLNGHILENNPAMTKLLGYGPDELRRLTSTDIKHPANTIANMKLFEELRLGKREDYRVEQTYQRKDGSLGWGRFYVSLVRGKNGEPQYAIGMLEDISDRKKIEQEIAELQRRLMEGRESEWLQFARELHDGPVQDLYGIYFLLKAFSEKLTAEVDAQTTEELLSMLTKVINTLRNIYDQLRPPTLTPFGLEKAIRSYTENFQESNPATQVHLELMADGQRLPEQVRLALFRIYQQLLENAGKHANADHITVRFWMNAQDAVLEISDDGEGFTLPERWIELARRGQLGLVSASDRARASGGDLSVDSKPGQGTRVTVRVPRGDTGAT